MVAKTFGVGILLVFGLLNRAAAAETIDVTKDVKEAQDTVAVFKKADPGLSSFFENAVGYAVFPTVTKGAAGVGGAAGSGVVFEKGKAIGKTSLTQVTVGAQLGGHLEPLVPVRRARSPGSGGCSGECRVLFTV